MKMYVDDHLEVEKNVTWQQLKFSSCLPLVQLLAGVFSCKGRIGVQI